MDIFTIISIIAVLAIVAMLIQMMRVRHKSKVKINVKDERVVRDPMDEERLYRFTVKNDSRHSIVMTSVRLFSRGVEIFDNGHHPSFKAPDAGEPDVVALDSKRVRDISTLLSENFLGTTVVQPEEGMTYSYYLDEVPNEIKITVRENEKIEVALKPDFR